MDLAYLLRSLKYNFRLVYLLIGINIAMFLLTFVFTEVVGSRNLALELLGAEYFPDLIAGQLWRTVTASFLHAGILHLFINMWSLYSVGSIIERFYGSKKLFTIYILTAITSSLLSLGVIAFAYFSGGRAHVTFPISVGASGAIFGLVGVILGNKFKKNTYSVSLDNYINSGSLWIFVAYNILLGFGINLAGNTSFINNWAHLGGLIGGILLGMLLEPINSYYISTFERIGEKTLLVISIIFAIISAVAEVIFLFSVLNRI